MGIVPGFKNGSCSVTACKCYYNARSGWVFGYGEEELIKESSSNRSVCKNGIVYIKRHCFEPQEFCEKFLRPEAKSS